MEDFDETSGKETDLEEIAQYLNDLYKGLESIGAHELALDPELQRAGDKLIAMFRDKTITTALSWIKDTTEEEEEKAARENRLTTRSMITQIVESNFAVIYQDSQSFSEKYCLARLNWEFALHDPFRVFFIPTQGAEEYLTDLKNQHELIMNAWKSFQDETGQQGAEEYLAFLKNQHEQLMNIRDNSQDETGQQDFEDLCHASEVLFRASHAHLMYYHRFGLYNKYHFILHPQFQSFKRRNRSIQPDLLIWVPSKPTLKIIVDCNGYESNSHNTFLKSLKDRARDRFLQRKGYQVLRFARAEGLCNYLIGLEEANERQAEKERKTINIFQRLINRFRRKRTSGEAPLLTALAEAGAMAVIERANPAEEQQNWNDPVSIVPEIRPSINLGAQLRLEDMSLVEDPSFLMQGFSPMIAYQPAQPRLPYLKLDFKLRNIGTEVCFLKRVELEVLDFAQFRWCPDLDRAYYPYIESANFDVTFDVSPLRPIRRGECIEVNISQVLAPNGVDRFTFTIGCSFRSGDPRFTWYLLKARLVYNETNEFLETSRILLSVPPIYDKQQQELDQVFLFPGSYSVRSGQQCRQLIESNRERAGKLLQIEALRSPSVKLVHQLLDSTRPGEDRTDTGP